MNQFSFRFKIIATLVVSITLFSFGSFTVYNVLLKEKLTTAIDENTGYIQLLRDQYNFSIASHDGTIIRSMLMSMEKERNVHGIYLSDGNSKIKYSYGHHKLGDDTLQISKLFKANENVFIKSYGSGHRSFNRIFMRLENGPGCYSCHDKNQNNLGMIIMDVSNRKAQEIVSYTRTFSFLYTFSLLLVIFILVAYLHYRYIRRSLKNFRETINTINQGNLEARLTIPEAKELGNLGKSFNEMVDTFEHTQKELNLYHHEELASSQKLATIGEMSARIAHEIRNPITGIARALEIILSDEQEDRNKSILEEIRRQTNRVEQAISNLLKFSRSLEVRLIDGDINEVIKSMVFFLRHQAYDKTIRFEMELQEDLPTLFFDPELIENVLLNLSFNSIKYIPDEGEIVYKTWFDKGQRNVIIAVQDNGTGISVEVKDDIFKPFFTTHTKGTGLGLAISKDIVEKHKGKIWFENNKDAGCTLFVSLPVNNGKH
jgi:two-component system NtrC family sensor kinase